jgi:drug/metabolite transporter (DMT)-like permease
MDKTSRRQRRDRKRRHQGDKAMTATIETVPRRLPLAMLVSLVVGALLISLAPLLVRVSELEPVATGFYRVVIAAPFLWFLFSAEVDNRAKFDPQQVVSSGDMAILCLAGVLLACDLGLWHISITMTSVANATVFNNCAPLFVALFSWMVGRAPDRRFVAALALSFSGMAMLIAGRFTFSHDQLLGDALAISTGAFYGIYIILLGRMRQRYSTALCMAVSTTAATPTLLLFALMRGETLAPTTLVGWGTLVVLGLVCHVGGQGLIARSLAALPATFSSMVLLIQPVSAAILAWLLFGEAQTPIQILGIAVVLGGIFLAGRSLRGGRA